MKVFHTIILIVIATVSLRSLADPVIQLNDGLNIIDESTNTAIKLNGRLQIDYVNASLDSEMRVNDAEVKRAWLTLSGTKDDWFFLHRFDVDPTPDGSELSSFLEYRGFGSMAMVGVGRHKEPFGLRWRTSIKNTGTPERSAISDAHSLGRSVGVMMRGYGGSVGYEVGVFEAEQTTETSEKPTAKYGALTGRIFMPVKLSDRHFFHTGLGLSKRSLKDALNVELAYVNKRFHLQAEYFKTDWENSTELEDGVTIDIGWFFSSDSMPYKNGAFQKVKSKSDGGAWQIVVRFDKGVGDFRDIQLARGEGHQIAVGMNWFANTNTRLALSYTRGKIDQALFQGEKVNSELIDVTGEEIHARLQYTF